MTTIEWTEETWNAVIGCSRVSPGCGDSRGGGCYAERMAHRLASNPLTPSYKGLTRMTAHGPRWTGEARLIPEKLAEPLRWRTPRRVFVNSMSDLFHEKLTNEEIAAVFGVMAAAPQHTFQVLTKRAERMRAWFEWIARQGHNGPDFVAQQHAWEILGDRFPLHPIKGTIRQRPWPLPNVHIGVSVEDQKRAEERIPHLLAVDAAVRFISAEPLLGPVDLRAIPYRGDAPYFLDALDGRYGTIAHAYGMPFCHGLARFSKLDWVIVGGESGPGARPCALEWIESIVEQCREAGVACFFKQAGSNAHSNGQPLRLRNRKGGDLSELPTNLHTREFPHGA